MTRNNLPMILLGAGSSGRMGSPKALLTWPDGVTFVERLAGFCNDGGVDPVILVVNREVRKLLPHMPGVRIVINDHTDRGRFYSLLLGMEEVPRMSPVFIHNVDNPFLDADLLKVMMLKMIPDGFVVPVHEGRRGHPVLIGSGMADEIRGMDRESDLREVMKNFKGQEVVSDHQAIHWNINTQADYREFIDRLRDVNPRQDP